MTAIVHTIQDRCRRCYTCIRNCPAKAIRVEEGQAKVIDERCIGCGNCYRVCAQSAKEIRSSVEDTDALLRGPDAVLACLAPSFPAAFPRLRPGQVASAARALGFAEVLEVAFGAELVARAYADLARRNPDRLIITSPCPALVSYVEKYAPSMAPNLAPIVSPAIALGRVIKTRYRPGARVAFIGPCIAKKAEVEDPDVAGAVDLALTFDELERMWKRAGIDPAALPDGAFDGPPPCTGRVFPVSGGLLKTAMMDGDILANEILVTEGRDNVLEVLKALQSDHEPLDVRFLDILFCDGCIAGPVIGSEASPFARKEIVTRYVRGRNTPEARAAYEAAMRAYGDVDLSGRFTGQPIVLPAPTEEQITAILRQTNKLQREDELNCGACGYASCREKAAAVFQGLAEAQMCLPYLIDQLQTNVGMLTEFQRELQEAQDQLVQTEKLASVGQLAAGVAHEINDPLRTVMLYADLMLRDLRPGDEPRRQDLALILSEAKRCRGIVQALLNFSRQNKLFTQMTDVNGICEEALREVQPQSLFQGLTVERRFQPDLPQIHADPAQLRQALLNLIYNAAQAMDGSGTLILATRVSEASAEQVEISVEDTGCGIPEKDLPKLFSPFFTTKPVGKGTGLGLAITYGIVKMHRGSIAVKSQVGRGTTFTLRLPIHADLGSTDGLWRESLASRDTVIG